MADQKDYGTIEGPFFIFILIESIIPIFLSEAFRYSYYFQFCIATVIQYWNGENIGKLLMEISLLLAIDFIKVKHSKV